MKITIYVDADSVPKALRSIILKAAVRLGAAAFFVSDRPLKDVEAFIAEDTHRLREEIRSGGRALSTEEKRAVRSKLRFIQVPVGEGSADDWIVKSAEEALEKDAELRVLAVTHDIPLAARRLETDDFSRCVEMDEHVRRVEMAGSARFLETDGTARRVEMAGSARLLETDGTARRVEMAGSARLLETDGIARRVAVIDDRGGEYTREDIKTRLADRLVNAELRSAGVFADLQGKQTDSGTVKAFADCLDRVSRRLLDARL